MVVHKIATADVYILVAEARKPRLFIEDKRG